MSANGVPGIAAAVVLEGEPTWSAGFGMADLEDSAPVTPSTLFRLGSISKPITATAILQLWEHGKLDLDAPVQKYCPAFPQKESPITTRQLLGHLGGIRHYNSEGKGDIPEDSARHFADMQESLTIFAGDPLVAKPGTKFHYSTYGYTLVGCVLEGATSEKYVDYVRENIFRPAGMVETQADDFFAVIPHRRDLMWTSLKTADGKATGYGLGWGLADKFGVHIFAHTGGQQGTSTAFALVPERRAAVVVLANMDNVDSGSLADQILKIALDLKNKTL